MSEETPKTTGVAPAPRTADRLNLIYEVGRASLAKLEMGELLDTVAQAIHRHFGYYDVSIFLVDPEAGECVLVAQAGGFKAENVKGYRQKMSVGIVGWVAEHGQTILANDVRQDHRHIVAFPGEEQLLSELAVPIKLQGRTVGVINVEKREANAFDECDVVALETLSDQIAQAIGNAQLFEQTRLLLELNRSIIDAMPSGLCVLDSQMKILFANQRFCEFFGRSEEQVKGANIHSVLPPDIFRDSGLEIAIKQAPATSQAQLLPDIALRGERGERHMSIHVSSAQMPDGTGVLLMFDDITERHRAAQELLREKQKLEHVVRVIGAGLALIDRHRRIIWANPAIVEWFGRGREVIGRPCHEIYCNRDKRCTTCPAEECFATARNAEAEVALTRADGALRQYHHAVTPVIGPNGTVDHVLKLTLDITDQTKRVYQLERLRQLGEMMQGVLDLDRLLHFVLTCVTAGQALGFNRALLLLVDKDRQVIEGKMGVGPASPEEAGEIWRTLSREAPTLEAVLARYDLEKDKRPSPMDLLAQKISVPMSQKDHIVVACALGRRPIVISDAWSDQRVSPALRALLGSPQFVLCPLIARDQPVGVIIADNLFTRAPITPEHVELLSMFANQVAAAIDTAENYRQIQEEKKHLEQAYRDLAIAQDKHIRAERLAAIGRMAAHVAHEIRNPLVTIGGFANSILELPPSEHETITRYAKIIATEVRRLENILSRVMDFTRPPKAMLRPASIGPIIRATLEQLQVRARQQNVKIALDLPEADPTMELDADQMKQVMLNICQNALDAMRDGGTLSVSVRHLPMQAVITIANTGEPIRPEDMAKIFEPFFTTKPGGTGLGLAVSQNIVQDHGGDIRVASSLERGTEFIITLPRRIR